MPGKMALFGLDLKVLCFWALLQSVASEHVRITLEPGQYFNPFRNSYLKVDMKLAQIFDRTEVGVFALTVPALVKTMTEVSMVTVTQVSIETTAVEAASSATTVGLFFLSSLIQPFAKLWCVAHRNRPRNISAFVQSVELDPDTDSSRNSRGRLVACKIIHS